MTLKELENLLNNSNTDFISFFRDESLKEVRDKIKKLTLTFHTSLSEDVLYKNNFINVSVWVKFDDDLNPVLESSLSSVDDYCSKNIVYIPQNLLQKHAAKLVLKLMTITDLAQPFCAKHKMTKAARRLFLKELIFWTAHTKNGL